MNQGSLKQSLFLVNLAINAGIILLSLNLSAQQIHWANPLPTGNEYYDIDFFDGQHGLMCGEYGTICSTKDGGNNWEICFGPTGSDPFTQICILDSTGKALLRLANSEIIATDNYGEVWSKVYKAPDSLAIHKMQMLNENEGFAIARSTNTGRYKLLATHSSASEWEIVQDSLFIEEGFWEVFELTDIAFMDSQNGMIILTKDDGDGYCYAFLYKTTDGGKSFSQIDYPGHYDDVDFQQLSYLKDNTFIVYIYLSRDKGGKNLGQATQKNMPNDCKIAKTNDFGENWHEVYHDLATFKNPSFKTNRDSIIYLFGGSFNSEEGNYCPHVMASSDAGESWFWPVAETQLYYSAYKYPTVNSLGIIDKISAIISLSSTWRPKPLSTFMKTNDIEHWDVFPDDQYNGFYGMAILENRILLGAGTHIVSTSKKSNKWNKDYDAGEELKLGDQYLEQSICWYGGSSNEEFIVFSDSDGNNWQKVVFPNNFYADEIDYGTDKQLFLLRDNDYSQESLLMLYDFDKPEQGFLTLNLPENMLKPTGIEANEQAVFLFGDNLEEIGYFHSNDLGLSWNFINLELPRVISKGFLMSDSLIFVSQNAEQMPSELWSVNPRAQQLGELFFSGQESGEIIDVKMDANQRIWILESNSLNCIIYHQLWDDSWEIFGPFPGLSGLKMDFDGQHLWAYGPSGRLLYLGDGLPVGIQPIPTHDKQQAFSIEGNPFSNSLQISINLEFQGEAMLLLTDMNGKLVRQSKIMLHGRASRFLIQTHDLTPGAYVCSLVAGTERFNEKVVKK